MTRPLLSLTSRYWPLLTKKSCGYLIPVCFWGQGDVLRRLIIAQLLLSRKFREICILEGARSFWHPVADLDKAGLLVRLVYISWEHWGDPAETLLWFVLPMPNLSSSVNTTCIQEQGRTTGEENLCQLLNGLHTSLRCFTDVLLEKHLYFV